MDMDMQLRPERKDLVRHDVERGRYQAVEKNVEHAVSLLHAQQTWVAEHRAEINSKGSVSFDGESMDAESE
jgi:hypothetical protein